MKNLINSLWAQYLKIHKGEIEEFIRHPHEVQWKQLKKILKRAESTEWGQRYSFKDVDEAKDWKSTLPIFEYDDIKADIHRMMKGERDILWPGRVKYFAKSSGTTSDKSKYIPVTNENHKECHTKGGWRLVSRLYDNLVNPRIVVGKSILLAGSLRDDIPEFPGSIVGDVSAVIFSRLNPIALNFITPGLEINLLENFEEKLDKIASICSKEDITMVAGTPTWSMVLFKKILELTGKDNMHDVWPNMQVFVHGAVSFVPYRKPFEQFFPSPDMRYMETYNASEGYFAVQYDFDHDDMLLLLDNGVFYEFIPMSEWEEENPKTHLLSEVEIGKNYAMVITTNSGLYRYKIGDTICFTSTEPYKIKITGRIKQFINVFGEEVMVSNTDQALADTCATFKAMVKEYTVAPIFLQNESKGGHEWVIEFEKSPSDPIAFAKALDQNLQRVNSDYEAKRYKNLALDNLKLNVAPEGTFMEWMKFRNKIGAQQKVPRLSNTRQYIDEILNMMNSKS
ncbi:MAG: GH3 auxin-responsive promoter family protein [Saprospiraceae bacterium]|nr:GH3 auxin-responsive promoter family protein [Candidatus Vicinibacter affinis]MBP6173076.1 GH3 auxin-responsive promoter family protein [Saprospiraceae bacterium]MBK6573270.1 GH3 auxin-responsive promoter family protein [Candidatus Vicinibacter affinis]MBK7301953.1 GH3 auxin-responsive promoter family protein [Candidatus Vicinibacter affinis]MBK7693094.1 GH3 auxin-responsive promoter family protein [Candidatus Vicinibacter affinis]